MDQIAQELIDKFIDELHDDVRALQSCSLVSKRWVYRSQYHIFSRITISSQQSFERWCKNIPLTSCPVSAHTCTLSILQPTHTQWLTPLLLSPATGHFGAFNNVRTLALSGITTRGLQDAQLLADCFRRLGSSVTSLKLLYWRASPASLIDCICFFPHVDDLDVYCPDILAGLPVRKTYPSTPPFRGRLSLTFENGPGGIDRFLRLLSQLPTRFREVRVAVNFIGGQALLLPFFKSCSKSVQKLCISYEVEQANHPRLFKNLKFTNLRELALAPHNAQSTAPDSFLTALLQSICSSCLTCIRLDLNDPSFYMSMQEHPDRSLWNEIDTMLAGLAHQSVGKLALQVRSNRLKSVDWQELLPHFKCCGTLEKVPLIIGSDDHPLSPYFDGQEPFLGHYAAQNKYWKMVDRVHRCIEADTTLRKLEGWKNRGTDTTSLAEKIRRRNVKKRRATARPV
ncbi:hypothetical protein BDM02DRAFT_3124646 [Thelephora ganbajun]|uniref:Uncharacterized protein n=1 Tax=Thelephora ganbajun TaxID=370292 RepID=A0ACB6YYI2_THEGA|nr:hypothetical protein BDM02DRAFT_3124646 [Thelephora ganbajun]